MVETIGLDTTEIERAADRHPPQDHSKMAPPSQRIAHPEIAARILIIRSQRVLLDADLASLYGVPTKALNQAVRRNQARFPSDFSFRIDRKELSELNRSHFVTGSQRHRDPRFPPLAFTEHGAVMAANVLSSDQAIEMSIHVVRAFIDLRQLLATNADVARKLDQLEKSVSKLDARTRKRFEEVYAAIRALMAPAKLKTRPIGFTAKLE